MRLLVGCAALMAASTVSGPVVADVAAGQGLIEEVVVWGTRVESSSVRVDEDALAARQADHISDLLRTIPGVDVGGAHSLNQRITIRSMDDKDLRISIDGANQNTYMYHHMGNLQIHADILQAVAVDVGKNSVINGGLGGVVRFTTKSARDLLAQDQRLGMRLQGGWSDNASTSYSATGYAQLTEQLDALVYFNHVDRNNYDVGGGKIEDENGAEVPGTDGEVRGLEGELDDLLVKFGWEVAPGHRLSLGYEQYVDEGDYSYRPDMGLATDLAIADFLGIPLVYPTEFSRDTWTLNYTGQLGEATQLDATVFQTESTMWRDERGLVTWRPPLATINEGEAENTGVNLLASTDFESHTLNYGFEIIEYETAYATDGVTRAGEDATHRAVYFEDRFQLTDRVVVVPGVRWDSYNLDATVVDDTFDDVTFGLSVEARATDAVSIRVSATEVFKGPEIGEVFVGAGLFDVPNPDIDAESGLNLEGAVNVALDQFHFGLTLFSTRIDDYIYDYASNPAGGRWKDNVGDMTVDGYEAYVGFDNGTVNALLTFSDAESDLDAFAPYAGFDGARIDRQQGETISLVIDYAFGDTGLSLHWSSLYVDDVGAGLDLDGATLNNAKDGYDVHNVSLRWTPKGNADGFSLTVGVDNLFDEFYASQSSRTGTSFHPLFQELYLFDYEPGRNLKATAAYRF